MRPYEKLVFYQKICEVRKLVYQITKRFPGSHYRLVSQMRDAARSSKQNIREGYSRGTAKQYIQFIRISLGSLDELIGDIDDCKEDNLISDKEHSLIKSLGKAASFLAIRYIESIKNLDAKGQWKTPTC
ncbi:MAG: four helix bundle protein [bacterium]